MIFNFLLLFCGSFLPSWILIPNQDLVFYYFRSPHMADPDHWSERGVLPSLMEMGGRVRMICTVMEASMLPQTGEALLSTQAGEHGVFIYSAVCDDSSTTFGAMSTKRFNSHTQITVLHASWRERLSSATTSTATVDYINQVYTAQP